MRTRDRAQAPTFWAAIAALLALSGCKATEPSASLRVETASSESVGPRPQGVKTVGYLSLTAGGGYLLLDESAGLLTSSFHSIDNVEYKSLLDLNLYHEDLKPARRFKPTDVQVEGPSAVFVLGEFPDTGEGAILRTGLKATSNNAWSLRQPEVTAASEAIAKPRSLTKLPSSPSESEKFAFFGGDPRGIFVLCMETKAYQRIETPVEAQAALASAVSMEIGVPAVESLSERGRGAFDVLLLDSSDNTTGYLYVDEKLRVVDWAIPVGAEWITKSM
jgi:hypothetical protein